MRSHDCTAPHARSALTLSPIATMYGNDYWQSGTITPHLVLSVKRENPASRTVARTSTNLLSAPKIQLKKYRQTGGFPPVLCLTLSSVGRTVAAAAGGFDDKQIAWRHLDFSLTRQNLNFSVVAFNPVATYFAGFSAV